MTKNMVAKNILLAALCILIIVPSIDSAPPQPWTIKGKVFYSAGAGADNGIPVIITNMNTQQEYMSEVYAPPIPQLKGEYSASIQAAQGDQIKVLAYNDTHYGESISTTNTGTLEINVTMNITRDPEFQTIIIFPQNLTTLNMSETYNATINTTLLGNDGTNCSVELIFSNSNLGISPTETNPKYIGDINVGTTTLVNISIKPGLVGYTDITANAICEDSDKNIEKLNNHTVYNIESYDDIPPEINLTYPENNTENKSTNTITFTYNVYDNSPISECSLVINNEINETEYFVSNGQNQIQSTIENQQINWSINCTDSNGNQGSSETFTYNISVHYPEIQTFIIPTINLNPGAKKNVKCNATVTDLNGASDINNFNSTLKSNTDPSFSYYNSSCEETGSWLNQINYTCTFSVDYYAINGTWSCNASAEDQQGLIGTNSTNTTIDPLYAINTSTNIIDYGAVPAGDISGEENLQAYNLGNQNINVTIRGYGGQNDILGNGYAMLCQNNNNISIEKQKYSDSSAPYATKTSMESIDTNTSIKIMTSNSTYVDSKDIYFQIEIPPMPITQCNGTIVLTASGE